MPELIRTQYDLPTLSIHIAPEPKGELYAVFDVLRGRGQATTTAMVATRALGLPDRIRSAKDVSESRFALAGDVVERISTAMHGLATDVPAYWLELPPPRGYLQLVPWERLLSPPSAGLCCDCPTSPYDRTLPARHCVSPSRPVSPSARHRSTSQG
jgi:hypothetical protein